MRCCKSVTNQNKEVKGVGHFAIPWHWNRTDEFSSPGDHCRRGERSGKWDISCWNQGLGDSVSHGSTYLAESKRPKGQKQGQPFLCMPCWEAQPSATKRCSLGLSRGTCELETGIPPEVCLPGEEGREKERWGTKNRNTSWLENVVKSADLWEIQV